MLYNQLGLPEQQEVRPSLLTATLYVCLLYKDCRPTPQVKKHAAKLLSFIFANILTDFKNSFIDILWKIFNNVVIKYPFTSHLSCVAKYINFQKSLKLAACFFDSRCIISRPISLVVIFVFISPLDKTLIKWEYGNLHGYVLVTKGAAMHVSKIVGVHLSFLSLQTFNYSSQKASREEKLGGCPPPQPTRGSGGASQAPGRSPSRERFWGIWCTILRDFTHLLVHLTAVWKWEIPTSLYWLVDLGMMFPFNFLGCRTSPTSILGVSGVRTPTTSTVAGPLLVTTLSYGINLPTLATLHSSASVNLHMHACHPTLTNTACRPYSHHYMLPASLSITPDPLPLHAFTLPCLLWRHQAYILVIKQPGSCT